MIPILGAVPDGIIIYLSGMKSGTVQQIKDQLDVGVGALAGASIMLITVPLCIAVFIGSRKLDDEGRAMSSYQPIVPGSNKLVLKPVLPERFSLTENGVTALPSTPKGARWILITCITYLFIQIPAFFYKHDADQGAAHEKGWAIAGFIVAGILFFAYLIAMWRDADNSEMIEERRHHVHKFLDWSRTNKHMIGALDPATLFALLDKDGDGLLDAEDLRLGFKTMGLDLNHAEAQAFFNMMDADGNIAVDLREFVNFVREFILYAEPRGGAGGLGGIGGVGGGGAGGRSHEPGGHHGSIGGGGADGSSIPLLGSPSSAISISRHAAMSGGGAGDLSSSTSASRLAAPRTFLENNFAGSPRVQHSSLWQTLGSSYRPRPPLSSQPPHGNPALAAVGLETVRATTSAYGATSTPAAPTITIGGGLSHLASPTVSPSIVGAARPNLNRLKSGELVIGSVKAGPSPSNASGFPGGGGGGAPSADVSRSSLVSGMRMALAAKDRATVNRGDVSGNPTAGPTSGVIPGSAAAGGVGMLDGGNDELIIPVSIPTAGIAKDRRSHTVRFDPSSGGGNSSSSSSSTTQMTSVTSPLRGSSSSLHQPLLDEAAGAGLDSSNSSNSGSATTSPVFSHFLKSTSRTGRAASVSATALPRGGGNSGGHMSSSSAINIEDPVAGSSTHLGPHSSIELPPSGRTFAEIPRFIRREVVEEVRERETGADAVLLYVQPDRTEAEPERSSAPPALPPAMMEPVWKWLTDPERTESVLLRIGKKERWAVHSWANRTGRIGHVSLEDPETGERVLKLFKLSDSKSAPSRTRRMSVAPVLHAPDPHLPRWAAASPKLLAYVREKVAKHNAAIAAANLEATTPEEQTSAKERDLPLSSVILLKEVFAEADSKSAGSLALEDVSEFTKRFNIDVSPQAIKLYFYTYDTDLDRHLSIVDFKRFLESFVQPFALGEDGKLDEDDDDELEEILEGSADEPFHGWTEKQKKWYGIFLLVLGTAIVAIFSEPMIEVIGLFGNSIGVKPFYVSFVVTPFASNAAEVIASLIFAMGRTNVSMGLTLSSLYGATAMNNTFCVGIFLALIAFRELPWTYTAEAITILIVEITVALICMRETLKQWHAVCIGCLFPFSLFLVWFLESVVKAD